MFHLEVRERFELSREHMVHISNDLELVLDNLDSGGVVLHVLNNLIADPEASI